MEWWRDYAYGRKLKDFKEILKLVGARPKYQRMDEVMEDDWLWSASKWKKKTRKEFMEI